MRKGGELNKIEYQPIPLPVQIVEIIDELQRHKRFEGRGETLHFFFKKYLHIDSGIALYNERSRTAARQTKK